MRLLVINCGSATVKFKLYDSEVGLTRSLISDTIERQGASEDILGVILSVLPGTPEAVVHRIVHGGAAFASSVLIDEDVLARLHGLAHLAPLHNPPALTMVEAARRLAIPMIAAFDTAFHHGIPLQAREYALPESMTAKHGIRRYGFHGFSFAYIVERYRQMTGAQAPTLVTLHLGNGCSAAAILEGKSIDTSMGFSPLEGLVMGTRTGDLDPGVVLHLLRSGHGVEDVERMLYRESGLLAIAGTNDMRLILGRRDEAARLAVELFCYRIRKYVGSYLAALGGAQAVVFTGGIGENAAEIRRRVMSGLEWAGIELDHDRNEGGAGRISADSSRIHVYVIATDEEQMMAREACRVLKIAVRD